MVPTFPIRLKPFIIIFRSRWRRTRHGPCISLIRFTNKAKNPDWKTKSFWIQRITNELGILFIYLFDFEVTRKLVCGVGRFWKWITYGTLSFPLFSLVFSFFVNNLGHSFLDFNVHFLLPFLTIFFYLWLLTVQIDHFNLVSIINSQNYIYVKLFNLTLSM